MQNTPTQTETENMKTTKRYDSGSADALRRKLSCLESYGQGNTPFAAALRASIKKLEATETKTKTK